jgi:hypothetical protein
MVKRKGPGLVASLGKGINGPAPVKRTRHSTLLRPRIPRLSAKERVGRLRASSKGKELASYSSPGLDVLSHK